MTPFEPVGDEARWRVLYRLMKDAASGALLTYEAMAGALALDPKTDRHTMQLAMRRAARELELEDRRAIVAVRGEGYRVANADQHFELARMHQGKSVNSLERAKSKTDNVDYNHLSPDLVALAQATSHALSMQLAYIERLDVRQGKLAESLAAVEVRQQRTAEEIDELRERLARVEKGTVASGELRSSQED